MCQYYDFDIDGHILYLTDEKVTEFRLFRIWAETIDYDFNIRSAFLFWSNKLTEL